MPSESFIFNNNYNRINLVLVGFIIVFWVCDVFIDSYTVSILLRTRGCMRLVHVPNILENIRSHWRLKRGLNMMDSDLLDTDKPNSEKIIELLLQIGDAMEDPKFYNDIHYCIKHIASGTLYEVGEKDTQTQEVKSLRRRRGAILQMEEQAWIKSCTNMVKLKRDSKDPGTIVITTGGNLKSLESLLDLNFSYSKLMEDLDTLEFDIFDLKEKSHDRELTTITSVLFHKHSLYSHYHINLEKFLICMDKITSGYNKSVKYHNSTHAADVCQTLYSFIINGDWISKADFGNIDISSMILGTAVHDYEHPGYNNIYLINTSDNLAVRYNDISVLENHHIASSLALMKLEKYNFLDKVNLDDKEGIRKRMIHIVLSTDMSKHFADLGTLKSKISSNTLDPAEKDKLLCMGIGCHLADISNPSKPWNLTLKWTELLFEEFFKQGDKERDMGIKVSDLMDRTCVNIAKAQLGFIDVIVKPSFEAFSGFLKCVNKNIKNIKKNRDNWDSRVKEYHQRMISEADKIKSPIRVIEEEKSENEEDSQSNKLSDIDSSEPPSSFTSSNVDAVVEEFGDSSFPKPKNSLNKMQSNIEDKTCKLFDL